MEDEFIQAHFEYCRRVYEDMLREGRWPWEPDSPNSENLIESDRNPDDV